MKAIEQNVPNTPTYSVFEFCVQLLFLLSWLGTRQVSKITSSRFFLPSYCVTQLLEDCMYAYSSAGRNKLSK